jgi:cobalamin biosynthesis protein CobD/CbiB
MAAMAGALHVTLSKRGHYTLDGGSQPVTPDVLARGRRIVRTAAVLGTGLCVLAAMILGRGRRGRI